ncbi:hypothetical protein C9J22_13580 [Photobacterium phosphoreum]|nr:hypothetical protein C9J22_13580 [Photobacterium phosphoreum]
MSYPLHEFAGNRITANDTESIQGIDSVFERRKGQGGEVVRGEEKLGRVASDEIKSREGKQGRAGYGVEYFFRDYLQRNSFSFFYDTRYSILDTRYSILDTRYLFFTLRFL